MLNLSIVMMNYLIGSLQFMMQTLHHLIGTKVQLCIKSSLIDLNEAINILPQLQKTKMLELDMKTGIVSHTHQLLMKTMEQKIS